MPHQLPHDQPDHTDPSSSPNATAPSQQTSHEQELPNPPQRHSQSSRDLALQSFPQQTDQPRLRSQPIQTSSSPPPPDSAPAVQKCAKCELQMQGSFVRALGATYHLDCFRCLDCDRIVASKFFPITEPDGKQYPLCERDYFKRLNLFWNVKLSFTPQSDDEQAQVQAQTSTLKSIDAGDAREALLPQDISVPRSSMEQKTPEELKRAQQQMEEKVYQIWTVLSAFEESSAGCISEMLLHVSNGAYYDGVQMAEKFILHVEILFSAIDDLEAQMKEVDDQNDLAHGREAKMLCKKIVNFFSLLSHTQESGVRRLGMTQELLSLVTGLAHYLKILIRIALTCALKLERQYHSKTVISRFLNKLMELANKDKCLQDLHGKGTMDAEVTSDLCLSCRITIEDECFTLEHQNRWHPKCLVCAGCAKPLASIYHDASFDPSRGRVYCQQCKTPESQTGFSHVTKLEQYTFLLRVALIRLENLLQLKGDDSIQTSAEQRGRHLATSPTAGAMLSQGLIRKDSRSKSYPSEDSRQYEGIHLGDIKRVKSTHLDRKLSNSARFPRRQTLIEHQRRVPRQENLALKEESNEQESNALADPELSLLEFEIIDEAEIMNDDDDQEQVDSRKSGAPVTLSDLTDKLWINKSANRSPTASLKARPGHASMSGSQHLSGSNNAGTSRHRKRQYLNELSALELFIVKHLAVLTLAPIVSDHFTLEELLDLIGQRKNTFWGRIVKGLKTDKKKPKVEGTFGVPLEILVERNGVDSVLGAGPGRIRIPSFVDDSISAMRNMDMSVEGVFRKNGNIRRLKELSDAIDKDPSSVNLAEDNPVQVAALLKKFLRDLPDPLLTFKLHRLFIVSQKMEDEATRKMILHLTCCLLPKPNRDCMEAICLFLRWVASFSHVDEETGSKMDLHNLATVITPNVLYSKSKDPIKDESFLAIEAVMGLLEFQEDFCVVPEDLSLILSDQDLVESSTDLSSKDILKRCENLVRAKVKKSTSLGEFQHEQSMSNQDPNSQARGAEDPASTGMVEVRRQSSSVQNAATMREQSVPVMIQQPSRHITGFNHGPHGLSTSHPPSSSSGMGPMRIPERPQAVSVGGGKGATPMSL
ncbi:hypothetical protein BGX20_011155 [Mortierella sp. AD010]|nr:hypothetical protein BGX20_011155 [Mortierella sp. AD010]